MLAQHQPPSAVPLVHAHHRRGAAAVELAIVLPVFMLLLGGIIEFGQGFMIEHTLSYAARRGARQASLPGVTNTTVETMVKSYCASTLNVATNDVTVGIKVIQPGGGKLSSLASAQKGDACQITVTVPFSKAGASFILKLLGGKNLSSTCTLERE